MTNIHESLSAIIKDLEDSFQAEHQEFRGQHKLIVPAGQIVAICRKLKDEHNVEMLSGLSAVDYWPEREPRFHVVYEFKAIEKNYRFELRAPLNGDEPSIDTVSEVYPVANWPERELYDMFGIHINNHPDLRRILMPEDWTGHPLRKDYPLDYEEVQFSFNFEEIEQRKPRPKD